MISIVPPTNPVIISPVAAPVVNKPVRPLNFAQLKKSDKFNKNRVDLKKNSLFLEFAEMVKSDLESYEGKYDYKLVEIVCNIAEEYFVQYPKMGNIKKKSVLKPYFNCDVELIDNAKEFVFPLIIKSNIFRRNKQKIQSVLTSIGQFFFQK